MDMYFAPLIWINDDANQYLYSNSQRAAANPCHSRGASTIDALILATARHLKTKLINGDPAFQDQRDVRAK